MDYELLEKIKVEELKNYLKYMAFWPKYETKKGR